MLRCFLALLLPVVAALAADKPNVIFILADDLGAHDLGCFGSSFYETPNLDRLAKRGTRFTQAYAASPLCSPTRSSILVGQYPARTGITAPVCHINPIYLNKELTKEGPNARLLVANSVSRLKPEYFTLSEALKEAGYATAHFGKWHLGHNLKPEDHYEPQDQGFDSDFPHVPNAAGPGGGYLAPWKFIKDPTITDEVGVNIEDRMSKEAAKYIAAHKAKPFYLNYWAYSVHSPWNARADYIEHFKAKADPKNPQHNALYAAMVKSLDDGVGRIVQAIDDAGIADNTIIVFYSDNGGYAYPPKKTDPEGYADIPATSNLPLRSGKASLYEGGTREPFIFAWPGKAKAGATSDILFQSVDFYPTLLTFLGLKPHDGLKLDGLDQSKALLGGESPRDRVFCHFPHGSAARDAVMDGFYAGTYVRKGDWKLIRFYARNYDGSDDLELYDLKNDLGERHNLAKEKPKLVTELNGLITDFLKDTEAVIPKLNPNFGKAAPKAPAKKKALAPDDLPGDWKNRAGKASVTEGALHIESKGANSFLGVGAGLTAGKAKLSFRIRAPQAGEGKVTLLGAAGGAEVLSVTYRTSGEAVWQTISVDLEAKQATGILRLYLPTGSAAVDLDDIVLTPAQGAPRRWEF
ncbi:MAG: sulfatase-like hydrolase/transferase [Verrucomicrobia bacterium]|nr:sulfatase-like hydrolase/transferase [Verrucomicrobiota bacterium]